MTRLHRLPICRPLAILVTILLILLVHGCALGDVEGDGITAEELAKGFAQPPDSIKPWVYWYWISDNITQEGITRDLEAMARVGIGEALIGNIGLDDIAGLAKAGENTIEIDVVNTWANRLIGDSRLPEKDRRTWVAVPAAKPSDSLMPSGLLGPVTIRSIQK